MNGQITEFIKHHYRHFNAAALIDAAEGYRRHLDGGGKMMITLAGAMSTAELGLSLAEMIRQDKVQIISCTGANLEEDLFNLVAHDFYERVPNYRDLTPEDEQALLDRHMNRVTDTCIPEHEAMRRLEKAMVEVWTRAEAEGERYFPHEFMYQVLKNGSLEEYYQIDVKDSWMYAAMEKNLPMVVPGWEDSTMGNMFAGHVITGDVENVHTVRTGIEYMTMLADWYTNNVRRFHDRLFPDRRRHRGRFPICVVPMLHQDLQRREHPRLGLFLPDIGFDHLVRLLLRRRAERKDHLGQARGIDTEIHHRIRRLDRRPADVCVRAGVVGSLASLLSLSKSRKSGKSSRERLSGGCP
jgi:deoxyhypusine synthase